MEPAKSFEDLIVWQKAHEFVLNVYAYTQKFPREELYGLTTQFRRAAISVAANIAEGFKKRGTRDKAKYLNTSQASLQECRYYILLSKDLDYGENQLLEISAGEVGRMLESYRNSILQSSQSLSSR